MKNIIILNGAPKKNGNTASLLNAFKEGAQESGNQFREFYLHGMNIKGCLGCNGCKQGDETCVQKDDMEHICEAFLWADVVVFVSPVFWGNITGQLKTAIDRLYALQNKLGKSGFRRQSVLLMTAGAPYYTQPLEWYSIFKFLDWENLGEVLGAGKEAEAKRIGVSIS